MSNPSINSPSLIQRTEAEFAYRPLDLAHDSLRLIRVRPDRSADGFLQLDLWHSVMPAKYRCVSYQWGSVVHQHKILINGCKHAVGDNLHAFLQEMYIWAIHGFEEPIWIDVLCIDQGCNAERGHQVQRMGSIYSNAQEVFVWLGDHGELAEAFHEWLSMAHEDECPAHLRNQWDKIRFNGYWQRAWIKQEILLAQRVTIVLRGAKIEWTVLGGAIARSGSLDQLENEHAAHLWTFWGERWSSKHGHSGSTTSSCEDLFSFWSLMHTHRRAECTDKRDRVYSLLGLVSEKHEFVVDYNESTADLFWRVSTEFEVGDSPELVDILRVALLDGESDDHQHGSTAINPWSLVQSVLRKSDLHVRIPVRRVATTDSIARRIRRTVRCKSSNCKQAPRLPCGRDDMLICTNERSDEFSEHGCIHAIAHPLDQPAAEPYEIQLVAHHRDQIASATLLSTAVQVWDIGTEQWVGISTWSSLEKALSVPGLERINRVKLLVPATYAMMIWFGVHPSQLDDATFIQDAGLPSAYHALPIGTKITKRSIELPPT